MSERLCIECGAEIEDHPTVRDKEYCFSCWFWLQHIQCVSDLRSVRIDGRHYRIGDPATSDKPGYLLGFGGTRWVIRFDDDRVVETNNLWHQGTIPRRFAQRLPNNASFVKDGPVGGTYGRPKVRKMGDV